MKIGYIGGGSLRVLSEVRALMGLQGVMSGCEIALFDHDEPRVNAMATLLRKAPEIKTGRRTRCGGIVPDKTIEGADFVEITARPWSEGFLRELHHGRPPERIRYFGQCFAYRRISCGEECRARPAGGSPHGEACREWNDDLFYQPHRPAGGSCQSQHQDTRNRHLRRTDQLRPPTWHTSWDGRNMTGIWRPKLAGINHIQLVYGIDAPGPRSGCRSSQGGWETGIDYEKFKHIGKLSGLCIAFRRWSTPGKKFGAIHYSIDRKDCRS